MIGIEHHSTHIASMQSLYVGLDTLCQHNFENNRHEKNKELFQNNGQNIMTIPAHYLASQQNETKSFIPRTLAA